jgi:hypothetical protein
MQGAASLLDHYHGRAVESSLMGELSWQKVSVAPVA